MVRPLTPNESQIEKSEHDFFSWSRLVLNIKELNEHNPLNESKVSTARKLAALRTEFILILHF